MACRLLRSGVPTESALTALPGEAASILNGRVAGCPTTERLTGIGGVLYQISSFLDSSREKWIKWDLLSMMVPQLNQLCRCWTTIMYSMNPLLAST